MMSFHHHLGNASSAPLCLLGDRRKPGGSAESIHRSLSLGEAYQAKKPRLCLIQGELIDLTGDPLRASVLWQLVFWSQRVPDVELFAMEEKRNAFRSCPSFSHGWFYKSLEELRAETRVRLSLSDFYDVLNALMDQGWVQKKGKSLAPYKENQAYHKIPWRVPLGKICQALHRKGYVLPGFVHYGVFPHSPKALYSSQHQHRNPYA
jgi:hypothetical protein